MPETSISPGLIETTAKTDADSAQTVRDDPIPARMLNEFVYCPRLFYYEHVEGVFVESADTLRGAVIHERVDSGSGAMPAAKKKIEKEKSEDSHPRMGINQPSPVGEGDATTSEHVPASKEPETIHSRSVQMGSERLCVVAKMDLVESRRVSQAPASGSGEMADLFAPLEVCPVDYKAGAPKEGADANELWDTDKMQLGLQALILRDNGYTCHSGVIYYRTTRQRVSLPITADLESWVLTNIAQARRVVADPIPPPLLHSPKCARCSLAPVCLPDETRMLADRSPESGSKPSADDGGQLDVPSTKEAPRRLMAARDDPRPLYLNSQGKWKSQA